MSDLFNELYFYKEAWLQKFLIPFIIATQNAKHHIINLTKILQFYRNYYFHNLNYDYMCVHVCVRTMFMLQWGNDVKMASLPNSTYEFNSILIKISMGILQSLTTHSKIS